MLDVTSPRKNKINLADYNSEQDIQNRIILSDFTPFDLAVLEEILFSPLKISLKKMARNISADESDLTPFLEKMTVAGLLTVAGDAITVDKDMRKYFEFQVQRFDPDFKPDMEFLHAVLRRIPTHILPTWYSISRTSSNVFDSIVEKHLLTPQVFQRHLSELNITDPTTLGIMKDVLTSDLKASSSDLIAKYNLTRPDFERIMLHLEFSFICSVRYVKEDDHWHEVVTPFHEWSEYLTFLKETNAPVIDSPDLIIRRRENEYAFVEDMTELLQFIQKKPPATDYASLYEELPIKLASRCELPLETSEDLVFAKAYFSHLIEKICLIKLADQIDGRLYALDTANDWLDMTLENKVLFLYRHPLNRILSKCSNQELPTDLVIDRNIREAEKSIKRVMHGGWVLFDDFIKGVFVSLNDDSIVMLKKTGKQWQYSIPTYSDAEVNLIKATIFDWLFEAGIVATGTFEGRDCFAVTAFGRFFFAD
ncbi:MAG: hypothetical protein V4494_04370 [Chlamydiota bacterium]